MSFIKEKLPSTREEWLEGRKKGIGGSDAGVILGLNAWKSPYMLWCEKTGRIKKDYDNEAMRQGRDLEAYVAERFTELTGKKVRRSGYSFQSVEHPFMLANVDRLIVGEKAGLECKTTNMLNKTDYAGGDVPPTYYAQCQHYMAVTGLDKWYIAVLVLSKDFYVLEIERNEEYIETMITYEQDFWELVTSDQEPAIDGSESTEEALKALYPDANDDTIDLIGVDDVIELLAMVNLKIKEFRTIKRKCESELKQQLGQNCSGRTDKAYVNWKQRKKTSIDTDLLKKEYPDVYKKCLKQSTYRQFGIKEVKNGG